MHSTLESPGFEPIVEVVLDVGLDVVLLDLLDGGGGRLLELLFVAAPFLIGDAAVASEAPFFLFSSSSTYWSLTLLDSEDFRLIRGRFVFDGDDDEVVVIVVTSFEFAAFTALGFLGGRPRPLLTGAGEAADVPDVADVLAFDLFNVKGELFLELFRLELFFDEALVVLLCRRRVVDGDGVGVVVVLFLN